MTEVVGTARGDHRRTTECLAEQHSCEAIGIREVRIDQIERKSPPEPGDERHQADEVEDPVQALAHPGETQISRVVNGQSLPVLTEWGADIFPTPEPPVAGEPRDGRND